MRPIICVLAILALASCHSPRADQAVLPYQPCPVSQAPRDGAPWRLYRVPLSRYECAHIFTTTARWERPVLNFRGQSELRNLADQHAALYRTVRFGAM